MALIPPPTIQKLSSDKAQSLRIEEQGKEKSTEKLDAIIVLPYRGGNLFNMVQLYGVQSTEYCVCTPYSRKYVRRHEGLYVAASVAHVGEREI